MTSAFQIPSFPLNRYIDHFFYYSGYNPEHRIDRLLPDGEVQLIFELTGRPNPIFHNESLEEIQTCRRVWFSGFRTEPISIPSGQQNEMIIVQFMKGRTLPFLREPMQVLTNLVVDAGQVLDSRILEIYDQLQEAGTPAGKFRVLEEKLQQIYLDLLTENPFVDFAVERITGAPDRSSIAEIAGKTGYSQKHFIRMFREHVGVTPKEFLKVIRFQRAVQRIEQQLTVNWSHVAYDCGYYDQSHFIADFKTFSGLRPSEYLQMKGDQLNYIPMDLLR